MGVSGFLEDQLARTGPDAGVESRFGQFAFLGRTRKQTYDEVQRLRDQDERMQLELTLMAVLRGTYSENQLFEMMCQLWMDHFNINLPDRSNKHLHIDFQENVIRPNAMGNFRDLLVATANATAMLTYLNNDVSNANSSEGVNENYGRELLELHTLGIDENGNQVYTEVDVRQASLAMSGWSMERNSRADNYTDFRFRNDFHHTGPISLLNGAWTRGATTGKATGDSLLEFLATHPSTARYVAYKICRRFVSDQPPAALVDSTAQVFLANDTAIVPTLRHVFTSAEFAAAENQKLRRPMEQLIASLRALNSTISNDPDGDGSEHLLDHLEEMDHVPWGWVQPDGYPDRAAHWLTTDNILQRWNHSARLARNVVTDQIRTDYGALRPTAATADELIAALAQQFGIGDLAPEARAAVATAARVSGTDTAASVSDQELADIAGLLMAHPLFQTR